MKDRDLCNCVPLSVQFMLVWWVQIRLTGSGEGALVVRESGGSGGGGGVWLGSLAPPAFTLFSACGVDYLDAEYLHTDSKLWLLKEFAGAVC